MILPRLSRQCDHRLATRFGPVGESRICRPPSARQGSPGRRRLVALHRRQELPRARHRRRGWVELGISQRFGRLRIGQAPLRELPARFEMERIRLILSDQEAVFS